MKYSIACLALAVSIANPVLGDTVKIPEDMTRIAEVTSDT
jgi:hypothetical protein